MCECVLERGGGRGGCLTLKVLITTAADDNFFWFCFFFIKKISEGHLLQILLGASWFELVLLTQKLALNTRIPPKAMLHLQGSKVDEL